MRFAHKWSSNFFVKKNPLLVWDPHVVENQMWSSNYCNSDDAQFVMMHNVSTMRFASKRHFLCVVWVRLDPLPVWDPHVVLGRLNWDVWGPHVVLKFHRISLLKKNPLLVGDPHVVILLCACGTELGCLRIRCGLQNIVIDVGENQQILLDRQRVKTAKLFI